jgi:hypothetical protein
MRLRVATPGPLVVPPMIEYVEAFELVVPKQEIDRCAFRTHLFVGSLFARLW